MARKRERFERSDVPKDTKYRPLIGLAVLAIIGAVGFFFVRTLWGHVQIESRMGDPMMVDALDDQTGPTTLEGNFEYTENDIEKIFFLQVDDVDAERPKVVAAQLLLLDPTGGTAHLVDVPVNMLVNSEGSSYAFNEFFSSFGPEASVRLLATAYNIYADHVIMGTINPWDRIMGLDGVSSFEVVGKDEEFVRSMRTDLDAGDIVKHAALLNTLGVGALEVETTPLVGGTPAEGEEAPATVSIDLVPFGIQTGILIPNE